MTKVKKNAISICTIIILVASLLLTLETKHPHYFLDNDNSSTFLPYYIHAWRSVIDNNTLPFFNSHQSLGEPFLALGQTGTLYPPIYLSVWLSLTVFQSPFYTIEILVASHLLLAAIAMYTLLRRFSVQYTYSVLLSILWITYPYILGMSKSWANISFLALFLPLNYIFLESLIKRPNLTNITMLAVTKACYILSGYPQPVFLLTFLEAIFLLWLIFIDPKHMEPKKRLKIITAYCLSSSLVLLLSAALLFPMYEITQNSAWRSSPMPISKIVDNAVKANHFFLAQIFQFKPKSIYNASSELLYFGWFNIGLLLLLTIRKIRTSEAHIRITLYALLSLISYLLSTSLYKYLYPITPFNVFRGPHKFFPFALFFATIAIAGIIKQLSNKKPIAAQIPIIILITSSIALNIHVIWQNSNNTHFSVPIELPIDLGVSNYLDNTGRVITQHASSRPEHQYKYLAFDFATLFGYYHFGGYNPLISKINHNLTYALYHYNHFKQHPSQKILDHLSTWGVKYFINTSNNNEGIPQLTKIFQSGNLKLYKNTAAKPFVYSKLDPDLPIPHHIGINHIDIYPPVKEAQTLVVSFAPLPRWYLFLDDKAVGRIKHKNTTSPIQVDIPANTSKVTIRYIDYAFVFGAIISLTTILGICAYALYGNRITTKIKLLTKPLVTW